MTNDTPTPAQATELLRQAAATKTSVRGDASWTAVSLQLGLGAASSMYLLGAHDGRLKLPLFIGLLVWAAALLIFHVAHAKLVKQGFAARWGVFMAAWTIAYTIGALALFPYSWLVGAVLIFVASLVGAVMEVRK